MTGDPGTAGAESPLEDAPCLAGFDLQRAALAMDGTAAQKHVFLVLAVHLNAETGRCDPGVPLLAKETSLDERTVQRSLVALEAAGHLERVMRSGKSTSYLLHPRHGATPGTVSPRHGDAAAVKTATPGTVPPKQQRTSIPQKASPSSEARAVVPVDLPDGVTVEQWEGFVAMRLAIKKPLTARAVKLAVKKLAAFAAAGADAGAIVDESTLNNWAGLYPLKDGDDGKRTHRPGAAPAGPVDAYLAAFDQVHARR